MIKNKIALLLFVVPLFGYASEGESSTIENQNNGQKKHSMSNGGQVESTKIVAGFNVTDEGLEPLTPEQVNDIFFGNTNVPNDSQSQNTINDLTLENEEVSGTVHDEWLSKTAQPNEIQEHEASQAKNSRNRFDNPDDERLLNEVFADIVELKQTEPTIKHDNKLLRGLAEADLQALEKAFDTALAQDIENNQLKPISQDEFDKALALNASKLLDEMVNNKKIGWRLYFMGYPFTYGFIFGIGLGFGYTLCNTLYNKYGEQWKAAFKRLIHACKNKICQNKTTVDTL